MYSRVFLASRTSPRGSLSSLALVLGTMSLCLLFFSLLSLTSLCIPLSLSVLSLYSELSMFSLALDVSFVVLFSALSRFLLYFVFVSVFSIYYPPVFVSTPFPSAL